MIEMLLFYGSENTWKLMHYGDEYNEQFSPMAEKIVCTLWRREWFALYGGENGSHSMAAKIGRALMAAKIVRTLMAAKISGKFVALK